MSSTGPAVLAGPPLVIAQASLESGAFRIATPTLPRAAADTTRAGSQIPISYCVEPGGCRAEDV
jgi:hypothetical protein